MQTTHRHFEMIVVDEKGDKIHVIVNNGRLTFLEKYFKEDKVVLLRNFSVIPNNKSYKYTKHPHKISFDGFATACRSNTFDADVNIIGFEFTKFSDIISLNLDTEIPVDIEGVVFSWECELRDYEVYGCKMKMLPLKLMDTLGIKFTCLVIGIMAENLLDYIKSTKNCNKFSMNMGNARVYDDGKSICIGSTFEIFD
ncbi:replication protein A 70 kDa DNA-binding subunit D [Artemisia annua]|uniref:Replication protein A 70 kDa DNA-binding subunit D n=1 Tax=Artemisia annua TaxID=35608 RepID=A0A2U1KMY7_ARTAN|nr:replication protein A 70 kDa DNA-binding subunit D [Artemisia annua]